MTGYGHAGRGGTRSVTGWTVLACLAAGPVFVTSIGVAALGREAVAVDGSAWLAVVMVLNPLVIAVGFVLAVLPTILGTAALRWAGSGNDALRLPVMWVMAGAGLAGGGVATAGAPGEGPGILAFALTGAICAAICRAGVRWPD